MVDLNGFSFNPHAIEMIGPIGPLQGKPAPIQGFTVRLSSGHLHVAAFQDETDATFARSQFLSSVLSALGRKL